MPPQQAAYYGGTRQGWGTREEEDRDCSVQNPCRAGKYNMFYLFFSLYNHFKAKVQLSFMKQVDFVFYQGDCKPGHTLCVFFFFSFNHRLKDRKSLDFVALMEESPHCANVFC